MKKHYLKDVQSVLALKDTDTKIYEEQYGEDGLGYFQFVGGVLCWFRDKHWSFCETLHSEYKYYILEEEPMQEATEADVGTLCKLWDSDEKEDYRISVLKKIVAYPLPYIIDDNSCWKHCRRLSPAEVAEITGYKVEEK